MSTNFPDSADAARTVDANTRFDAPLIRSLDQQIQAIGGETVRLANQTFTNCVMVSDPDGDGLDVGTVVAQTAGGAMVAATAAIIATGATPVGVLTQTVGPGHRGIVAIGGVIPASVSGLAAGLGEPVRANATTGLLERVGSLSPSDVGVGVACPDGSVVIVMQPPGLGASGGEKEIRFAVGHADVTTDSVSNIPLGAIVTCCQVKIGTSYPPGTTLTVGVENLETAFQGVTDNDVTAASGTIYETILDSDLGGALPNPVRATLSGAVASGACTVIVRFVTPEA